MVDNKERISWEKTVKAVARLIKARSPRVSKENLSKEAHQLAGILRVELRKFESSKKMPEDSYSKETLKNIASRAKNLSKKINKSYLNLMVDLEIFGGLQSRILSRLEKDLGQLESSAEKALKNGQTKKGRSRDYSKEIFCEAALQIYERARGISLDRPSAKRKGEHRRHMTGLFSLIDAVIVDWRYFQGMDSFKKFMQRYTQSGRLERAEVLKAITFALDGQ